MKEQNIKRLNEVLDKHKDRISILRNFNMLFDELKLLMDKTILSINSSLKPTTGDSLEILYKDPYSPNFSNQYIIYIRLSVHNNLNQISLYNIFTNIPPSLKFEGFDVNGTVKTTESLNIPNGRKETVIFEGPITEITTESAEKFIIDFIDRIYSV